MHTHKREFPQSHNLYHHLERTWNAPMKGRKQEEREKEEEYNCVGMLFHTSLPADERKELIWE